MALFKRKPTVEEYDEQVDLETAKGQVLTKQRENAELEAGIKELKSKYGPGWKKILGVGSKFSLQDIKVFLSSSKKGLMKSGSGNKTQNEMLSPVVSGSISRRKELASSTGNIGKMSVLPPAGIKRA